jgi:glycosyltransferase involved in cell wall biosynthesis
LSPRNDLAPLAPELVRGLVSVIMPVHNGEEFVGRAISSVLAQTYDRLELIVIDDGSTDATAHAVASICDSRVTLLTLGSNAGAYVARNHALRRASGEFIAFLDADDAWFPSKLERQVAFLNARPQVDMIHARTIDIFPSGERLARSLHRRASDYRENLCHDRVSTSTVVVRRAVLNRVGTFDESFRAMGDWDLWTRIMRVGRVAHLAEPLTDTWLREGSLQRGSVEMFEHSHRLVLDKRLGELERHGLTRKADAAHEYAVAAKLAWTGQRGKARRRLARSLRARPSVEALALLMILSFRPETAHRARMRLRMLRRALSR